MENIAYLFVAIYLAVDVLYITIAKPVYNKVVKKIQGKEMSLKKNSYLVAVLSYIILGLGWLFFVANTISATTTFVELLQRAVMYGLVVYGVFNTTLYVMLENWDAIISIRDTVWGVGWITTISCAYLIFLRWNKK